MLTLLKVAHRDRLCRFAFELLEYIFGLNQTQIKVVESSTKNPDHFTAESEELAQDLMAINTVFICKQQSNRAAENRRKRKKQHETELQGTQVNEDRTTKT